MGGEESHECTKLTYLRLPKITGKEKIKKIIRQSTELVNERELKIKTTKKQNLFNFFES